MTRNTQSIIDWRIRAAIDSNANSVYPSSAGQRPSFADHVAGTGRPVAQRRSAGMVGITRRSTGARSSPAFHPAMFRLDSRLKVFLHREAVDGRKSINGLALLVEQGLGLDPFAPATYVFSRGCPDFV